MAVTDHQRRLLGLALISIERFRASAIDIHGVQLNLTGVAAALESDTPESVRDELWLTEARLEDVRVSWAQSDQVTGALEALAELEEVITNYLSGTN